LIAKIVQTTKNRRVLRSLRSILPLARSEYSVLHIPGTIPEWMSADIRAGTPASCLHEIYDAGHAVRLVQDTGHDLWLLLSRRGLEIQSRYLVPRFIDNYERRSPGPFIETFGARLALLKKDHIPWENLVPWHDLSAHEKLETHRVVAGLEDHEKLLAQMAQFEPTILLQPVPGAIMIKMESAVIRVLMKSDRSTEIVAARSSRCAMSGYRQIGTSALRARASHLSAIYQDMPTYCKALIRLRGLLHRLSPPSTP